MNTYQVTGKISNGEKIKTRVVQNVYSKDEAMDYAAMFFNIDEIISIKQGELVKGIFKEYTTQS